MLALVAAHAVLPVEVSGVQKTGNNYYGQDLALKDSSAELIDETSVQNCVFNDFEDKET